MTALIRTRGATGEMGQLFEATTLPGLDWKPSIWPGEQVPVVTADPGGRQLKTMVWGLPQADFQTRLAPAQRATLFSSDLVIDASRLQNVTALQRCLIVIESYARPQAVPV